MVQTVERPLHFGSRQQRAWALALCIAGAGCQTTPEAQSRPAESPPADQPPAATDAASSQPSEEVPQDPAPVDAGAPAADLSFIHNQLILKPKAAVDGSRPNAEALRTAVEAATGAAVAELRPGPVDITLVVFAPTDPPRDEAALAELQAALEATDAYEYVQPNRLYEAKGEGSGDQAASP